MTKGSISGKQPLDAATAERLLDLLSSDNAFRRQFKKDPAAALVQVGVDEGTAAAAGCMTVSRIAPKAKIAAARETLAGYLTSTASQTVVFKFDAAEFTGGQRRK